MNGDRVRGAFREGRTALIPYLTGGYRSPADVICDGLDLLRAQATYRQHRLAQLREQVEAGLEQMRAGKVSEVDPMELLEEVEQEFAKPPGA